MRNGTFVPALYGVLMSLAVGKISFREYTASATSAVIQKKRLLITTCVALIFLLIGASMLFLLIVPGEKNRPGGTKTCDSDECLRAFYYLDRAGDLLADPCQDFHRQAHAREGLTCGRFSSLKI
ncbi:hypothetical protein MRX96_043633 [Rhipicephalus microplus]